MLPSILIVALIIIVLGGGTVLLIQWGNNATANARPEWKPEPQYNGQYADAETVNVCAEDTTAWPEGYTPPTETVSIWE